MPIWQPTWIVGSEVESLDGSWRGRIVRQYSDRVLAQTEGVELDDLLTGARYLFAGDLLPAVDRMASDALDRRPTIAPWCRRSWAKRSLEQPQRIVWRFPGARERQPTPGASPRPPAAPARPRTWA
jgi:hypothetical protein